MQSLINEIYILVRWILLAKAGGIIPPKRLPIWNGSFHVAYGDIVEETVCVDEGVVKIEC